MSSDYEEIKEKPRAKTNDFNKNFKSDDRFIKRPKQTSAKKHKHLRRKRNLDWNKLRADMLERERIADEKAEKFLKERNVNPGA